MHKPYTLHINMLVHFIYLFNEIEPISNWVNYVMDAMVRNYESSTNMG